MSEMQVRKVWILLVAFICNGIGAHLGQFTLGGFVMTGVSWAIAYFGGLFK